MAWFIKTCDDGDVSSFILKMLKENKKMTLTTICLKLVNNGFSLSKERVKTPFAEAVLFFLAQLKSVHKVKQVERDWMLA